MDDGSLFGKSDDVLRAWNIVKTKGPHLGLFSNLQKCEVISASGYTNSFQHFEPEIIRISDGNMSILGSAIGSKSHCESWVTNKLNKKLPSLINKLNSLDHAQSSFLLLLFCASFCKWFGTSEQCPQTCFQIPASILMKSSFKGSKIFWAVVSLCSVCPKSVKVQN